VGGGRRSVALSIGAVEEEGRGKEEGERPWLHPVHCEPGREGEEWTMSTRARPAVHQPAVGQERPCTTPAPRTLAAGPSPAKAEAQSVPAPQHPNHRGPLPSPLAAAWARMRAKPQICLPTLFLFLFQNKSLHKSFKPQMVSEKYKPNI